ncbi:uncharacterized protein RCO7_04273 [Rhynchosporium graminicola]|uniref:Uncharacterized protein n=1 Tax=Rhynchosporium graminicola TaxID=2792576 RepID=A0A1E1LR95_9HELO|nr:uncharacterized protein RCO7_04273 [Rhynchosporium commune]
MFPLHPTPIVQSTTLCTQKVEFVPEFNRLLYELPRTAINLSSKSLSPYNPTVSEKMDEEDDNGGLFNIEVNSEDERAADEREKKVPRDFQSEEDFQKQLKEWKPKVETGDLYKTLTLPISHPSKPVSQTILHAIEELYFYRRFEEARRVTVGALSAEGLIVEFRKTLEGYLERCDAKLAAWKLDTKNVTV